MSFSSSALKAERERQAVMAFRRALSKATYCVWKVCNKVISKLKKRKQCCIMLFWVIFVIVQI